MVEKDKKKKKKDKGRDWYTALIIIMISITGLPSIHETLTQKDPSSTTILIAISAVVANIGLGAIMIKREKDQEEKLKENIKKGSFRASWEMFKIFTELARKNMHDKKLKDGLSLALQTALKNFLDKSDAYFKEK